MNQATLLQSVLHSSLNHRTIKKLFMDDVNKLMSNVNNANLLLSTIPMLPELDMKIAMINAELEAIVNEGEMNLTLLLPRHFYGLRLNRKVKER